MAKNRLEKRYGQIVEENATGGDCGAFKGYVAQLAFLNKLWWWRLTESWPIGKELERLKREARR